jgi:CubicO group peptidase (beta-lactamase class C family)
MRRVGGLFGGVALGLAGLVIALTAIWLAHRVYWQRYFALASEGRFGELALYRPREPVEGATGFPLAEASPSERTIPATALDAATDYAARNASTSLLIWHRGKLQRAAYWNGTTAATLVNSRSLHKMLGGLVIAAAIQQGYIHSLDDPVADYITEWRGTPKAAMTIRHVLTMSSGLMWFGDGGGPLSLASRRYLDPEWERILIDRIPLAFPPGSAYDYSDITADLMPIIVQRATHQRYARFLSEAILKPIGAAGGEIWVDRPEGYPHGGCCLLLPPETWLRIGMLVLQGGRIGERQILPPDWTAAMVRPSPHNPHFGLMVWLGQPYAERRLYARPDSPGNSAPRPGAFHSEPYLARDLLLFDGLNGQLVYIVPSSSLVIVRTGLRPPRGQPEWDNSRLPNLILRGLGAEAAPGAPHAAEATHAAESSRSIVSAPSFAERLGAEGRFWRRWFTIRAQKPQSLPGWLDTPEKVVGPGDSWPGASVAGRDLGADGLSRAIRYAEHTQSLSLLVWRHGRLQYERYWGGAGPDTRSETYSMAKSVVALAVGLAIADGAIGSVDDAAARYLPSWRGTRYESISLRDLLTMTSGLEFLRINYGLGQSPWNRALRTLLGPDLVGPLLEWPLREVPGATFAYNSANTELLLAVLENATGERYASYLSRRLWQPLGAAPATLWLDRPGGTPRAFAYLQARPRDWLRLGVLLAEGGRFEEQQIVPAAWIKEMTTPSLRNPNYGFQIWLGSPPAGRRAYNPALAAFALHSAPYAAPDVAFFDGGGGHRVYVVPSKDLVIVRTGATNRPDWDDAVIPNVLLADLPD